MSVLPETAAVFWRPRLDEARLRRRERGWMLSTFSHTVPWLCAAAALLALEPLSFPVATILIVHAYAIPSLYANRGALVVRPRARADDGAEWTALGLLDTVTSPAANLTLRPGDAMAFFTDGVTDRRHGPAFYGAGRLTETARQLCGYPAAIIAAGLRASTLDFSAEAPRDDIAIVVLRNEGAS